MNKLQIFLNDKFILTLIVINAALIFLQEFHLQQSALNVTLNYVEAVFTLLFIVEAVTKISTWGKKEYFSNAWNIFDFSITVISVPSLVLLFFSENSDIFNQILILRMLRIFRVIKFFRILKFIPNVAELLQSINRAIKTSSLILIGFFIFIFIIAVFTCSLYREIAPEYFSNPFQSCYSIFRIFSVEGWYEIPDLIAERTSMIVGFLSKLYFSILLLAGGIFGLSLVNSIFVEAMISKQNDNIEGDVSKLKTEIEKLNAKIDLLLNNQISEQG